MSSEKSSTKYCKYCFEELENEFEKFHDAHNDCDKQFNECMMKFESFIDKIVDILPDHTFKIFLEPKINMKTLGSFSYNQFEHIQNKISKISSEFSTSDKFIIILFHNSEIAYIVCNQVNIIPEFVFELKSLLYLGLTFTSKFTGLDEFSLTLFPTLLCLDITLQTDHIFPRITNGGKHKSLKALKLTQPPSSPNVKIPDGIESCLDLEVLTLDIPFTEYPLSLCYLSKLQALRISGSKPNWKLTIPNSFVNLTSLQSLQIISNVKPYELNKNEPDELLENINSIEVENVSVEDRILSLQTIVIQGFPFGYDEIFPILNPRKISKLSLIYCDLDEIPEDFIIFESLKELDLSFNRIEEIPEYVRRIGSIQKFYIDHNKITDLTNICRINRIHFINASHNLIEKVPDQLIAKKKIKVILNNNKISLNQTI